jgi:hypothetical protein
MPNSDEPLVTLNSASSSDHDRINAFISRWESSGAAERANYQMFLAELCEILEVPRPDPTSPDAEKNLYVFDRAITRTSPDGSAVTNYIDLYKAGHFVCETKQGSGGDSGGDLRSPSSKIGHGKRGSSAFDKALERAYHQGRDYITSLPASHGRPPFLIVCDVGYSIDLYSEFTCTGGRYERFPDPTHHRILLTDLREPKIRERLRLVFTDPHSLDPSKRAAEVTRDIATRLAKLAKSLEADGHDPQIIAGFLQRCLFTMFAEDIGLLPENGFRNLLEKVKSAPQGFTVLISGLWKEMATGTQYSALLFQEIAHFNGGLFESTSALPLTAAQLDMLADAAATDWSDVEPSIFGTLLTRALDSRERHKLGAEYTPRSYVERLIRPTIIEPLREEWEAVRISAAKLHADAESLEARADSLQENMQTLGTTKEAQAFGAERTKALADAKKKDAEALKIVTEFHRHLCSIKVLDPACGTANFLYVTLEHLKRLEAEVLELMTALGGDATFEMNEYKVRPEQFLGLELSPNAVAIAQLVLWIGYFQWQRKTTGKADTGDRPLLPKTQSIKQQDAVLAYDERIPCKDPITGEILTIWNGYTTKPHPITGKEVPDETARTVLFDYINPRRAEWPKADYIVGNPPFLGAKRLKDALGDGYTVALQKAWKGLVPGAADFVFYWWKNAADLVVHGKCIRFGFITTNSLTQTTAREIIEIFLTDQMNPGYLVYAIPDHPWIDSIDGAAVRIAMTTGAKGRNKGKLALVQHETPTLTGEVDVIISETVGDIHSDLTVGAATTSTKPLIANSMLCWQGCKLVGSGFQVNAEVASTMGEFDLNGKRVLKSYWAGSDLASKRNIRYVIDFFGYDELQAKQYHPVAYQHLLISVKPERDQNRDQGFRDKWWLFGRPRPDLRAACQSLKRYIATSEVAKHRCFVFLAWPDDLVDGSIMAFASEDAYMLGVLSSCVQGTWALATGGNLGGNTPRYNKSVCFDPFPFPALEEGTLKQRIRDLGERIDAHRKRQQELHPGLTLTGMYNVLEKIRAGETLNAKEKTIHDQGLITLLQQFHDELDAAVLEAYGWSDLHPINASNEAELLTRLVALNHTRAAEEKSGLIRWLRPEYQNPTQQQVTQTTLVGTDIPSSKSKINNPQSSIVNQSWPEKLPEQVTLVRQLLTTNPTATPEELSNQFGRKNQKRVEQIEGIIETLKGLGQV